MDLLLLGNKIRLLRAQRNLSQESVANDLGLSIGAYSKIERGQTNIPYNRLLQICDYYSIPISVMVGGKETLNFNGTNVDVLSEPENVNYSQIHDLKKEVEYLKKLLVAKDEIILLLRAKYEGAEI